jgi:hypothetical protein
MLLNDLCKIHDYRREINPAAKIEISRRAIAKVVAGRML